MRYKDLDFVSRIRRWPPVMVKKLEDFLALRGEGGGGGGGAAAATAKGAAAVATRQ